MSDLELILFNDYSLKMTRENYYKDKNILLPVQAAHDKDFIKQLSGQTLIRDKKTGKFSWKAIKNDHWADAVKYCVLSSIIEHITPGMAIDEGDGEEL